MNGGNVRPENQAIIEEAIMRTGYSPNHLAGASYLQKLYLRISPSNHGRWNYWRLVCCMERRRGRETAFLPFVVIRIGKVGKRIYRIMVEKGVDGIIVSPVKTEENYLVAAQEAGIPLVILEDIYGKETFDVVQVDCATSSYEIVESLIKKGHKKIAILKGTEGMTTAKERLNGYLRVMKGVIPVNDAYLIDGDYDYHSGYEGVKKLWKYQEKPTALFVTNYHMCIGALVAVKHLNIQVPRELSIVSFDDMDLSALADFKITTVRQPMEEITHQACNIIEKRVQGDYSHFPEKKRIKAKVIYRDFNQEV